MNLKQHIFLYGPSGSGKSTLARQLARMLEMSYLDLDDEIEHVTGRTIPQIFSNAGEQHFRQIESQILNQAVNQPDAVIALGGGTLLSPENRKLAEAYGEIVCLQAPFEVLRQRLHQDSNERPLLAGEPDAKLQQYLRSRNEHYGSFECQLDTGVLSVDQALMALQTLCGRYSLHAMQDYQVRISPYLFDNLSAALPSEIKDRRIVLVTDGHLNRIYQRSIEDFIREGLVETVISLPAGEDTKSLHHLSQLWDQFLSLGLDRKSVLVTLGGGVIGDLVGFAAATYMRGIRWIHLPSSLLAQVDASIGGKTGINLAQGKNLAGAFYPPNQVLIDPNLLATLSALEIENGMAEVIKHGVIAGGPLMDLCRQGFRQDPAHRTRMVRAAAAVKIRVVEQDPFESRLREVLNFGHTIGHAIEKNANYTLKHGQAVAIGMAVETYLAESIGLAQPGLGAQLNELLQANHLPTEIPEGMETEKVLATARFDKKARDGKLQFALPAAFGSVQPGVSVDHLEKMIADYRTREK